MAVYSQNSKVFNSKSGLLYFKGQKKRIKYERIKEPLSPNFALPSTNFVSHSKRRYGVEGYQIGFAKNCSKTPKITVK